MLPGADGAKYSAGDMSHLGGFPSILGPISNWADGGRHTTVAGHVKLQVTFVGFEILGIQRLIIPITSKRLILQVA